MYHHIKRLMYTVRVGTPDPVYGKMLLEQFGGQNGELAAAMQYTVQGINTTNPSIKDLLMDIGTEELSHLEVIGNLAMMHLKPMKGGGRAAAEADPLLAITGGGGVNLVDSAGNSWTSTYLKVTGEPDIDLRNNIAAEARAKVTYDRLMQLTDDPGTIDALQFLMTREITHMRAFMQGLESLGKAPLDVGFYAPMPGLVDQFFNDSTGEGEDGAKDVTDSAPWIKGFEVVDNPGFNPEKMTLGGVPKSAKQDISKSTRKNMEPVEHSAE